MKEFSLSWIIGLLLGFLMGLLLFDSAVFEWGKWVGARGALESILASEEFTHSIYTMDFCSRKIIEGDLLNVGQRKYCASIFDIIEENTVGMK